MGTLGTTALRSSDHDGLTAGDHPAAPLLRRLSSIAPLPEEDRTLVESDLIDARSLAAHAPCIRQGHVPRQVFVVVEGWMMRWQILPDGSRQVTGFLLPGDFCNDPASVDHGFDSGVSALGPARVAALAPGAMERWYARPALQRALEWARHADHMVQRSWIVSIGRRDAYTRLAYLLCQLHARLGPLADAHGFALPATQEHLADALGLTPVHVNRVLKRLREDGLVDIRRARVHFDEVAALRDRAGFSDRDVHLGPAALTPPEKGAWSPTLA